MQLKTARTSHEVRGVKFEVEGKALVCSHCKFQVIPPDLLNKHAQLVDEGYRKAAGLLSAESIRAARTSLGLNQLQFAEYLGVGEASVKRWELGALQDKSSDYLMRLKTDPEYAQKNLESLCERLGRKSPTAPQREVIYWRVPAEPPRQSYEWDTESVPILRGTALSDYLGMGAVN
jgi:putative zinc finger/helix-turn-helix YgiT family protein